MVHLDRKTSYEDFMKLIWNAFRRPTRLHIGSLERSSCGEDYIRHTARNEETTHHPSQSPSRPDLRDLRLWGGSMQKQRGCATQKRRYPKRKYSKESE